MEKLKTDFYIFDGANLYTNTQTNNVSTLHSHEFYEIFYVIQGSFIHVFNEHEETLEIGDIRLISPDVPHMLAAKSNSMHRTFIIPKEYFESLCDLLKLNKSVFNHSPQSQKWRLSFKQVSQIENLVSLFSEEVLNSQRKRCLELNLINSLLTMICDLRTSEENPTANIPTCIQNLLEIINTPQFFKSSSINEVIHQIGYSTSYISHLFKKTMGFSIADYVKEKRVVFIEYYLRNTGYSLTEICFLVGLKNLSHFNNLFKEKYGVPPSKYRKQHKAGRPH